MALYGNLHLYWQAVASCALDQTKCNNNMRECEAHYQAMTSTLHCRTSEQKYLYDPNGTIIDFIENIANKPALHSSALSFSCKVELQ